MSSSATSSLDLDLNEDQLAIADAVKRFCETRCNRETVKILSNQHPSPLFQELWQELADMGLLAPATPEGKELLGESSGALDIAAINEALGAYVFPGPLAASYLSVQVLPKAERQAIIEGNVLVSLSQAGETLLPWGMDADDCTKLFLILEGREIYLAEKPEKSELAETLGGEPWARIKQPLVKKQKLENAERGLIVNHIASASFLIGACFQFIKETSDYAATRKQFGKTLGEFQGVAHPLADCQIALTATQQLSRAAACAFDAKDMAKASEYANGAKLAAEKAALETAYVCHQVYAAIGITLEGPAFHFSRRIRQIATQAPNNKQAKEQLLTHIGLGI